MPRAARPGATTWHAIYQSRVGSVVSFSTFAKLFSNGRSQAVRLPREFRFTGDRVRIRRAGRGVLLEPIQDDPQAWFEELDQFGAEPFMPLGRIQPPTSVSDVFPS